MQQLVSVLTKSRCCVFVCYMSKTISHNADVCSDNKIPENINSSKGVNILLFVNFVSPSKCYQGHGFPFSFT